jgi:hypothetical protein
VAHRFFFRGGTEKVYPETVQEQRYKFFIFAILEDKELILYDAIKKGVIKKLPSEPVDHNNMESVRSSGDPYVSFAPEVKIFMNSSGFGVRKSYYSFFFRFDASSSSLITILPFGPNNNDCIFRARGRFMSNDEIKDRFGEDSPTYNFYLRQAYLSKAELSEHVKVGAIAEEAQAVRVLRF